MKKLNTVIWTVILWVTSSPVFTMAQDAFSNQRRTDLGVPGWEVGGAGSEGFIDAVQNGVNYLLGLLGLITIIILIWGGFQMVTAAWDDGKYKKWFTIVKHASIGLILIGVSALIVNLIFFFVNDNTATAGGVSK